MTITTTVTFTAKAEVEFQIPDSTPAIPAAIEAAIKKSLKGGMPTDFVESLDDACIDFVSASEIAVKGVDVPTKFSFEP